MSSLTKIMGALGRANRTNPSSSAWRPTSFCHLLSQTSRLSLDQHPRASAKLAGASTASDAFPLFAAPSAPDVDFLRKLVTSIPFAEKQPPAPRPIKHKFFELAPGTHFQIPSRQMGLGMTKTFAHALRKDGIVAIELGFEDARSHFMLDLVQAMGCHPDTHSSSQGALWDITYKPEGIQPTADSSRSVHSRSHGVGEFTWHTDGSYEDKPQPFFGLHIIHPDRLGGGIFRVVPADALVAGMKPSSVAKLLDTEFSIKVPDEFYKSKSHTQAKLLSRCPETGKYLLRFRRDLLGESPSATDAAANEAVADMLAVLDAMEGWRFHDDLFKENVILLINNGRFLHMRSAIKDKRRLIRRVRFHGMPTV